MKNYWSASILKVALLDFVPLGKGAENFLRSPLHSPEVDIHVAAPEAALAPLLCGKRGAGDAVQHPRNGAPRQRPTLRPTARRVSLAPNTQ